MRHIIDKNEEGIITHTLLWDDMSEQARAVESAWNRTPDKFSVIRDVFHVSGSKKSWFGRTDLKDWKSVREAIETPWKEGMETIKTLQDQMAGIAFAPPKSIKRRGMWGESDGDFDFERFANGLESFRTTARRDMTGQQFVTLLVQVVANCGTSAESMMWRGAAAIAATDILEQNGYSVELIAVDTTDGTYYPSKEDEDANKYRYQNFCNAVWIKRPDQPLDTTALVSGISPWYFRTLNFASRCMVPDTKPTWGLGYATKIPDRATEKITGDPSFIRVEDVWNKASSVKLANKIVAQFAEDPEDREKYADMKITGYDDDDE